MLLCTINKNLFNNKTMKKYISIGLVTTLVLVGLVVFGGVRTASASVGGAAFESGMDVYGNNEITVASTSALNEVGNNSDLSASASSASSPWKPILWTVGGLIVLAGIVVYFVKRQDIK